MRMSRGPQSSAEPFGPVRGAPPAGGSTHHLPDRDQRSIGREGLVMEGISRLVGIAMVASLAMVAAACGDGEDDELPITSEVVSDPTVPELRVLAPTDEGPWPVV